MFAVLPVLTARTRRTGDAVAAPLSRLLLALLGLQLALGIGAYLARFSPLWIPGEQTTMLVLPVAHRLVAGLILSATVVLAVRLHMHSVAKHVEGVQASERVSASSANEGVRGKPKGLSASSANEGVWGKPKGSPISK